jgi:hypothetical protein
LGGGKENLMSIRDWYSDFRKNRDSLVARDVLEDCEQALGMLQVEDSFDKFRVIWVAAIAQVRAVGHVLHKVDGERNPKLKRIIEETYSKWKKNKEDNAIFWDFIENERNSVLKQYEFGFLFGPIGVITPAEQEPMELDEGLFCPILEGRYQGKDCRDVLADAIKWWKNELSAIEVRFRSEV